MPSAPNRQVEPGQQSGVAAQAAPTGAQVGPLPASKWMETPARTAGTIWMAIVSLRPALSTALTGPPTQLGLGALGERGTGGRVGFGREHHQADG